MFTCDMCQKAVFHSREALQQHVDEKHDNLLPERRDLEAMARKVQPHVDALTERDGGRWERWGAKTFDVAAQRDAGPQRLRQACLAREQLELAVRQWRPAAEVYVFGSSVAMGIWDGLSDIDFTVVDVEALEAGDWPTSEKAAVRELARVLRSIGFTHQKLEAIEFARVPIIKHSATLPAIRFLGKPYESVLARTTRVLFRHAQSDDDRAAFEKRLLGDEFGGVPEAMWWDHGSRTLGLTWPSTSAAVRSMLSLSRREGVSATAPLHDEFRPDLYHVDFDLSFRTFGIRNSQLLRAFLMADACCRPGALVLKEWSKSSGVNNSINGFLTSYAVNILWIYFLVRKGVVPFVDPASVSPKLSTAGYSKDPVYEPLIPATLTDEGRKELHLRTGRLLLGFFAFYCFEFDWENHVVSLNRPGITTKAQLGWTPADEVRLSKRSTRYEMCIEDPYEENLNLGRHIGECRNRKVMAEFRRGLLSLIKDDADDSCVFPERTAAREASEPPLRDVVAVMGAAVLAVEKTDGALPARQFRAALEAAESDSLNVLLQHWTWGETVRRLGFKPVGDAVVAVRAVAPQKPKPQRPPPLLRDTRPSSKDMADRLIDEFVASQRDKGVDVLPDWVTWQPPFVPLPPAAAQRNPIGAQTKTSFVAPCGMAPPLRLPPAAAVMQRALRTVL